jgi:hypothetical protein
MVRPLTRMLVPLLAAVLTGCTQPISTTSPAPGRVVIYAIDGTEKNDAQYGPETPRFRGFPILGQVAVVDPETQREIVRLIAESLADENRTQMKCFWPRHAVTIDVEGKTTDYVLCFQCRNAVVYSPDRGPYVTVGKASEPLLTKLLTDAGVAIAP